MRGLTDSNRYGSILVGTIHRSVLATVVATLAACGGGGGGGNDSGSSVGPDVHPTVGSTWPSLAAQCVAPRAGIDPATGQPYPDRQGTLQSEQNWLSAWTDDLYLWYSEVPRVNPARYTSAIAYFDDLKTPNITGSGSRKDRFHFAYPTPVWYALSQSGVQAGYGATWSLLASTPPRAAVVAYTEAGSPANALSPPLARGARILQVDGVDLVNDNTQAGVDALNAGLYPASAGETHRFVVQDLGALGTRTITMVSTDVTSAPVQNVSTLAGGAVGYMLFNDHLATAESALINAIASLKAAGVSDLVIDMRYNGGGYLAIASELAYMVAGPAQTNGKTFELTRFNAKHPTIDPVSHAPIAPTPFYSTAIGFSTTPAGTALPHLDLAKVYVLTGRDTCSASEAVINGLRGAGVQVVQIGSTTCGKPYGFYPQDNCGTTYFSIQFQGVNAVGFGDYSDGFAPQNGSTAGLASSAVLPGCAVADDFTHALGDPAEGRLAAALQYRASGSNCPAASGNAAPGRVAPMSATEGRVLKSPFLSNRILLR